MIAGREPSTAAIRELRDHDVGYRPLLFDSRRYPGAEGAAEALGVDLHAVIKTIVMETDDGRGALVLMNGDSEVSTKALARLMSVKSTHPATQRRARKWTGYEFGGTSPFGIRRALTFNEDPYVLVTAWLIRTTTEVGQQRRTTETADAFLMGFHQGAWRTAWRYVDLDEGDWRLAASDDVGAEILSPELEAFIDRVRKRQVLEATDRLQAAIASGETTLVPGGAEP